MVKRYRTVSTRIEEGLFNRFLDVCESKDCKPNTMLKNYVEEVVKNVGKNPNERSLAQVENGNRQPIESVSAATEETGFPWG